MMVRVFANGPTDRGSIPDRVIPKLKKWYLMPPCLTLSNIKLGSRVNWSNPGKGAVLSPTPRCSSYRKGSLRVTLDEGRQLYFTFYFPINLKILRMLDCSLGSFSIWLGVCKGLGIFGLTFHMSDVFYSSPWGDQILDIQTTSRSLGCIVTLSRENMRFYILWVFQVDWNSEYVYSSEFPLCPF